MKTFSQHALATLALIVVSSLAQAESSLENHPQEPERTPWEWALAAPDAVNQGIETSEKHLAATPFFSYVGTWQANPVGGLSQSSAYAQETLFGATFDMARIAHIPGAKFQLSGSANAGRNLSAVIGNTFNVSQAFVTPTVLFYELWWQQEFLRNALSLRLGRVTSSEFATIPAFGLQVSGGLDGNPTSLFLNSNFSSSPNATWGARLKGHPSSTTYVMGGIYQASNRLGNPAYHGLDFSIRREDGLLMLAEMGWVPELTCATKGSASAPPKTVSSTPRLEGQYKWGAYFSTLPYQRFDSQGTISSTYGFYAMAQQMVWRSRANPNHAFSLWGGLTYSPQDLVAQMPIMGFAGTIWQGPLPGRSTDMLLCTWMSGAFSRAYGASVSPPGTTRPAVETVFELSYIINLTDNLFIQPDIQYVLRPNGLASTPNALVLGLQFGCSF